MNIAYLAEQSSDKPFLIQTADTFDYIDENTGLLLTIIVIGLIFILLFLVSIRTDNTMTTVISALGFVLTFVCILPLSLAQYGNTTVQTPEEFETWAHDRYGISVDINEERLNKINNNTELLTEEGDIVTVKKIDDQLILIESDDSNKELPLKSDR